MIYLSGIWSCISSVSSLMCALWSNRRIYLSAITILISLFSFQNKVVCFSVQNVNQRSIYLFKAFKMQTPSVYNYLFVSPFFYYIHLKFRFLIYSDYFDQVY